MPEIGENIAILVDEMEKDEKCNYKPDKKKWICNLIGNSTTLGNYLGNKPIANTESELSSSKWPSQAHHLIPHLTLKDHPVADWLREGNKLYGDTYYNVDHDNNGVWLPFASSLPEWSTSSGKKKRELMFKIMELSGLQMHQGPHSGRNDYGVGALPYKVRVNDYLQKIDNHGMSHYAGRTACKDCKDKKHANKFPPRENTVRYLDKASELLNKDIQKQIVFVSSIAAQFAQTVGF